MLFDGSLEKMLFEEGSLLVPKDKQVRLLLVHDLPEHIHCSPPPNDFVRLHALRGGNLLCQVDDLFSELFDGLGDHVL